MRIKKIIKYLSIITALFIALANHTSATSLSFSASGGSQTTNVNFPPVAWSLSSCPSWLSVSPASGTSAVEVTFTCSKNTSTSSRSGTVIFYSPVGNISVPVTQEGADPYLVIRTLSFWLSSSARTLSITVSSNTSWTVSESTSWLAVSPTSGSGSGSFSISITENTSTSLRSASVTVSGGGITKPISINQEGDVPVTHIIQSSAGSGGSISPSGNISVNDGSSQSFTITPSTGYHISNVNIDGALKGALSTYTFSNVTTGHYISASFAINTYTITASAGSGGSISPSGTVSVNYGSSKTFTITPSSGYEISSVVVDGTSQGAISSYTFSNVTSNHTISASFAISPPSTPEPYITEITNRFIYVGWTPVTGATGYYIYRATSASGTYSKVGTLTNESEYEDEDITNGVTYYYKVQAYNSSGSSSLSDYVIAITYPTTPTGLSATANSNSSITVTWTDNNSNETRYYIHRATSSSGTYSQLGYVGANVTTYTDTDLSSGT
ncbi:MAG: BACON domain-containing carbohydrate-binding protein, partial [Ignavibacteria bacterium]